MVHFVLHFIECGEIAITGSFGKFCRGVEVDDFVVTRMPEPQQLIPLIGVGINVFGLRTMGSGDFAYSYNTM